MPIYQRKDSKYLWYKFTDSDGRVIEESSKCTTETDALIAEDRRKRDLEQQHRNGSDYVRDRKTQHHTIRTIATNFLDELKEIPQKSPTYYPYAIGHLVRILGDRPKSTIAAATVREYQVARLAEGESQLREIERAAALLGQLEKNKKASPEEIREARAHWGKLKQRTTSVSSINDECGVLLRLLGPLGTKIRIELETEIGPTGPRKRRTSWRLKGRKFVGKSFNPREQNALTAATSVSRSRVIKFAMSLSDNTGMRDDELKTPQWFQMQAGRIPELKKEVLFLRVGWDGETVDGKSDSSAGRDIPFNHVLTAVFQEYLAWYKERFRRLEPLKSTGKLNPNWYLFPGGRRGHEDPTKPITTFKTGWNTARKKAGVKGRWHDKRHSIVTELNALHIPTPTVNAITGHANPNDDMNAHYAHVSLAEKYAALEMLASYREKAFAELADDYEGEFEKVELPY